MFSWSVCGSDPCSSCSSLISLALFFAQDNLPFSAPPSTTVGPNEICDFYWHDLTLQQLLSIRFILPTLAPHAARLAPLLQTLTGNHSIRASDSARSAGDGPRLENLHPALEWCPAFALERLGDSEVRFAAPTPVTGLGANNNAMARVDQRQRRPGNDEISSELRGISEMNVSMPVAADGVALNYVFFGGVRMFFGPEVVRPPSGAIEPMWNLLTLNLPPRSDAILISRA